MTDLTNDGPIHAALSAYRVASQNVRCPICNGIGGCDHTVRERMLADLAPIVPTEAMLNAGAMEYAMTGQRPNSPESHARDIYRAMVRKA